MIHLRPDCLVFRTCGGENIPCSAHHVTVELLGDAAQWLDDGVVQNAAEAVLHYFKSELGQSSVSVDDFSDALTRVLRALGVTAPPLQPGQIQPRVVETDLGVLARESGEGFELFFFQRLRDEVHQKLEHAPQVLRFYGLRRSVKQLTGAKRWGARCQNLNDQIVDYLRTCLNAEQAHAHCALVVL